MIDLNTIFPPLLYVGAARCDSPIRIGSHDAYQTDARFFSGNPHRRVCIRQSFPEEFDPAKEIGEWLEIPPLHVAVFLIAAGTHFVAPVYRGKAFWKPEQRTDAEVATITAEMQRREGIDLAEYSAFETKVAKQFQHIQQALAASGGKAN